MKDAFQSSKEDGGGDPQNGRIYHQSPEGLAEVLRNLTAEGTAAQASNNLISETVVKAYLGTQINAGRELNAKKARQTETDYLSHAIRALTEQIGETDTCLTVTTNKPVASMHRIDLLFGLIVLLAAIGSLIAIPFSVFVGLWQSGALEFVLEQPLYGAVFGLGPLMAALAAKGIRDTIVTDSSLRLFDRGLFAVALLTGLWWLHSFSVAVGFVNSGATGSEALMQQIGATGGFLQAVLFMEIVGGAAMYVSASNIFKRNAVTEVRDNPKWEALVVKLRSNLDQLQTVLGDIGEIDGETARRLAEEQFLGLQLESHRSFIETEVEAAAQRASSERRSDFKTADPALA